MVSLDKSFAILTAQHVVADLKNANEFGLCISKDKHRLIWQKEQTEIIEVGSPNPNCPSKGPDIALIKLLGVKLGTLKAKKSFYDLAQMLDDYRISTVDYNAVLYFAGFVGEMTKDISVERGSAAIKCFGMLIGHPDRTVGYWETKEFDFCKLITKCDKGYPKNYGGLSGGGLWKVFEKKMDDGTYRVKDAILCGVAYWQNDIEGNERSIIFNGYKSIYGPVSNALVKT